jgi:hypothetical protein
MQELSQPSCEVNSFGHWQADYAAHRIATFPVGPNKKPIVSRYNRFGLRASSEIARKYPEAPAIGFMCGNRSGVTVLDVDTTDERVLADALDRHGQTKIIVRSGGGHLQGWYRHNGERRWVRPRRDVPIDILGAGYVVAPPSRVTKGSYQFVQGSLDDLDSLPVIHNLAQGLSAAAVATDFANMREGDGRNTALFRQMMREAKQVDDYEQLLDRALTVNNMMEQPMEQQEVARIAGNVWGYTERGQNRFGQHGAWFPLDEVETFRANPDDFFLLGFLRANNHPDSTFMVANGLAERFGWWRQRLVAARRRLIQGGYLKVVRQAGQQTPALYRWAR